MAILSIVHAYSSCMSISQAGSVTLYSELISIEGGWTGWASNMASTPVLLLRKGLATYSF